MVNSIERSRKLGEDLAAAGRDKDKLKGIIEGVLYGVEDNGKLDKKLKEEIERARKLGEDLAAAGRDKDGLKGII